MKLYIKARDAQYVSQGSFFGTDFQITNHVQGLDILTVL